MYKLRMEGPKLELGLGTGLELVYKSVRYIFTRWSFSFTMAENSAGNLCSMAATASGATLSYTFACCEKPWWYGLPTF